jgi:hypothetical protein
VGAPKPENDGVDPENKGALGVWKSDAVGGAPNENAICERLLPDTTSGAKFTPVVLSVLF